MITLCPGTVARIMGVFVALLVMANIAIHVLSAATGHGTMHGLVRFFDLDSEMNLPTWYSSVTLLFSALLLAAIGNAEQKTGSWGRHWFGLSVIFAALSADEAASFHEIFSAPTRNLLGAEGLLYYAWVVPAAVLLLIGAVVYAKWYYHLPARTQKLAGLSAVLFVGGAMGLEFAGGLMTSRGQLGSPLYIATTTLEETLEMCGVLVWIYALLGYAASRGYQAVVRFTAATRDEQSRSASHTS